jgi:hypothetical protein
MCMSNNMAECFQCFTGSLVTKTNDVPRVVGKLLYSCSGPKDPYTTLHMECWRDAPCLHSFTRTVCLIKLQPCGGELFNTTFHTIRKRRARFHKADRSGKIVVFGDTTLRIPTKLILRWSPLRKLHLAYTKLGPANGSLQPLRILRTMRKWRNEYASDGRVVCLCNCPHVMNLELLNEFRWNFILEVTENLVKWILFCFLPVKYGLIIDFMKKKVT